MRPANGNGNGASLAAPKQGLRGRKRAEAARARIAETLAMQQSAAGQQPLAFQAGLEAAAAAARAPAAPFRDPSTHPTTRALAAADALSTSARLRDRAGTPEGFGTLGGGVGLAGGAELLEAAADAMAAAAAVARAAPGAPAAARLVREAAAVARSAAAALLADRVDARGGRRAPALLGASRLTGSQSGRRAEPTGRLSPPQKRHARSCQRVLCCCCLLPTSYRNAPLAP